MKMKRLLLIFSAIWAVPLFAQYGKIVGRVTNERGEPLPAATVRIVEGPSKGGSYADDKGYFIILRLSPGTYTLEASYIGYKPQRITNVVVESDRTTEINFRLVEEGVVVKEVVVEAKEPPVKKDVTESKATIRGENITKIPVATLEQAISLSSGVRVSGGVIQVRGGRPGEVSYVVDGVEVVNPYTGVQNISLPLNAIQEASVSKGGFGAEYGTASSGVVTVATREGSNKYELSFQTFSSLGMGGFFNTNVGDPYLKYFTKNYLFGGSKYMIKIRETGEIIRGEDYYNQITEFDRTRAEIYKNNFSEFSKKDPLFKDLGYPNTVRDFYVFPWRENYFRPIIGFGGPLLPFYDNLRFYFSYDYTNSLGTFPTQGVNQGSYQGKISWFITPQLKLFFGGVGTKSGFSVLGYVPQYRLILNRIPYAVRDARQYSFGINYAPSTKNYLEFRLGYFSTKTRAVSFVDVNQNGIADFADRDDDFLPEIDTGMLRLIGRSLNPMYVHEVNPNGWVEINAFWWENEPQGYYPTFVKGTKRQNYYLGVVRGTNDTVLLVVGDTLLDANGNPLEVDTVKLTRKCYIPYSQKDTTCETKYIFSNVYTPTPYTWYSRLLDFVDNSVVWSGRVDLLSQDPFGLRGHEFKAGFEYYRYYIYRRSVDYASGGNIYMNYVDVSPTRFAYYIRDKMEFEGFIANVGFRLDYFDPNAWFPKNIEDPVKSITLAKQSYIFTRDSAKFYNKNIRDTFFLKDPQKAPASMYISPRIGISHPISENQVLYFTYGHYFQVPNMRWLYQNQFWLMTGAFNVIGNPTLKPEKTISYEVGIKTAITPWLIFDITAFYKDIADLVQSKWIYIGNTGQQYTTFVNQDFGSVRGLEFNLTKTFGGGGGLLSLLTLNISYTLQFAKASFSSQTSSYVLTWAGIAPEYSQEQYVDWDERHVVNAVASFDLPIINSQITQGYGLAFIFTYGSGTPWSPPFRDARDVLEKTNTMRFPARPNLDFRAYKSFNLAGTDIRLFADIFNLLNFRYETGYDDQNYYYYFGDPEGPAKDPTVWNRGRLTRYGIQFTWKQK